MRRLLPILAFALLAAPAAASSIEPVASGGKGRGSVATISCAQCPPLKAAERERSYLVPELKPGTQKVEIREVDGERKMFRSEAWFGGSPVVFVSKAPEQPPQDVATGTAAETPVETSAEAVAVIDTAATTGAVDASAAAHAVTAATAAGPAGSRQLDPSTFELRLN